MIGVFDSGIGGLTVVKKIFEILPEYQILYFGDTARTPYGNRGAEVIKRYSLEAINFLIKKGAKIIIIACNTVSSVAYDFLKQKIKISLFEVVTPAVEKAIEITLKNPKYPKRAVKRIGVIGTRATIDSKIYKKLIENKTTKIKVFQKAAPLLVPLIEEGWLKRMETKRIVKKYLYPLKFAQIDTLILACTHYPIIKNLIKIKIGKRVNIVDSGEEVVYKLKKYLESNSAVAKELIKGNQHKFFVSDLTSHNQQIANYWLQRKIKLEKINL